MYFLVITMIIMILEAMSESPCKRNDDDVTINMKYELMNLNRMKSSDLSLSR